MASKTFLLSYYTFVVVVLGTSADTDNSLLLLQGTFIEEHVDEWNRQVAQDAFKPGDSQYACDANLMAPSPSIPTNVNMVRPADIKIVAALGDSLTAANGARAMSIPQVLNMYKGVSFTMGGDGSLADMVTIPNILKQFNRDLYGMSYKEWPLGLPDYPPYSQLNVAVPGSRAPDLIPQATKLVNLMKTNKNVDFQNDWKLVTIFVGGNDVCDYCKNATAFGPEAFGANLNTVMTTLSQLPRTIVQIVGVLHVEVIRMLPNPWVCQLMHLSECHCIAEGRFTAAQMSALELGFTKVELGMQSAMVFERDDFTLVVQPALTTDDKPPLNSNGSVDMTCFAPDCFHFSQKTHDTVARFVWNNMLQAVGNKTDDSNVGMHSAPLLCPDKQCPFIRTVKNSNDCAQYMNPL